MPLLLSASPPSRGRPHRQAGTCTWDTSLPLGCCSKRYRFGSALDPPPLLRLGSSSFGTALSSLESLCLHDLPWSWGLTPTPIWCSHWPHRHSALNYHFSGEAKALCPWGKGGETEYGCSPAPCSPWPQQWSCAGTDPQPGGSGKDRAVQRSVVMQGGAGKA